MKRLKMLTIMQNYFVDEYNRIGGIFRRNQVAKAICCREQVLKYKSFMFHAMFHQVTYDMCITCFPVGCAHFNVKFIYLLFISALL